MKRTTKIVTAVVVCGSLLAACAVYAAQPQMYEVAAFRSAISTLEGNYSNHSVLAANLKTLGGEVTKLNARLIVDGEFENAAEVKQTIVDADALVSRIDLADPLVTVDDAEKSGVELGALKDNLSKALDSYGLTHAVVGVERIELASGAYDGTVGDVVELKPAVYPTMVTDAILTYESSDSAVVTVDANGSVVLVGAGSAEVTVTDTKSGVQAALSITAKAVPVQAKPQTQAPAQQQKPVQQQQTPPAQQKTPPAQQQTPPKQTPPQYLPQITDDLQQSYEDAKAATGGKAGNADEMADLSLEEQREICANDNW